MLVLTRRPDEAIVIEGGIRITVLAVKGDKVRLGITAPPAIRVDRQEVHDRHEAIVGSTRLSEPFQEETSLVRASPGGTPR